jgi:hypothetical protein
MLVSDSNTSEIYLILRKNGEIAFSQTIIRKIGKCNLARREDKIAVHCPFNACIFMN